MKKIFLCLLAITCILSMVKPAMACEGARPLAMGGAFTGLADDANATYWNPAALGLLEVIEATYTGVIYDRDSFNYDDWGSLAIPIQKAFPEYEGADLGTFGFSVMNNVDIGSYSYLYYGTDINIDVEIDTLWLTLSYGRELAELVEGLCIGANLRYKTHEEKLRAEYTYGGTTYQTGASDKDSLIGIDLAVYYLWNKWSAGILLQNANEPELELFGDTITYGANLRPGVAYRFNDRYIISAEIYDFYNRCSAQNLRLGAEAELIDNVFFRLGGYDFATTEKVGRAITGGAGILYPDAGGRLSIKLDYAAMFWFDSEADTKDKFTHFLSAGIKF